jgi:hypothetical protein
LIKPSLKKLKEILVMIQIAALCPRLEKQPTQRGPEGCVENRPAAG